MDDTYTGYRKTLVHQAKRRLLLTVLFGLGFLIVLLPILSGLIIYGMAMISTSYAKYNDVHKKSMVLTIIDAAHKYFLGHGAYPSSLEEIITRVDIPADVSKELLQTENQDIYRYQSTINGQNCSVITILSTNEVFEKKCEE